MEPFALAGALAGSYNDAVLVLAQMLICAVKRETRCRRCRLACAAPATVNKGHASDERFPLDGEAAL
jgi:hypothetical protein